MNEMMKENLNYLKKNKKRLIQYVYCCKIQNFDRDSLRNCMQLCTCCELDTQHIARSTQHLSL